MGLHTLTLKLYAKDGDSTKLIAGRTTPIIERPTQAAIRQYATNFAKSYGMRQGDGFVDVLYDMEGIDRLELEP